jgi:hypothetical protein
VRGNRHRFAVFVDHRVLAYDILHCTHRQRPAQRSTTTPERSKNLTFIMLKTPEDIINTFAN